MTRTYYVTLFFLAPLCIVGGRGILSLVTKAKALPILGLGILLPYFLFTSGLVFEIAKIPNIAELDMPYSIALSSHRIDINGVFDSQDYETAAWLALNAPPSVVIYSDLHGLLFMYEWPELYGRVKHFTHQLPYSAKPPPPVEETPDDAWIFLRKWNEDNKMVTYWAAIGLRKSYTYDELGMDKLLEGRTVIYRGSSACVYGVKEK